MSTDTAFHEKLQMLENKMRLGESQKQGALIQWKRSRVDVSPSNVISLFSTTRHAWKARCALRLDDVHPALPMQLFRNFVKVTIVLNMYGPLWYKTANSSPCFFLLADLGS